MEFYRILDIRNELKKKESWEPYVCGFGDSYSNSIDGMGDSSPSSFGREILREVFWRGQTINWCGEKENHVCDFQTQS